MWARLKPTKGMSMSQYSVETNLYRPEEFKDNCGFGLIAQTTGEQSHDLVQTSIQSLSCMTHRGGIAADGKTGDGCGLLIAMPKAFFRAEAKSCGFDLSEIFGVGTVFLNLDDSKADQARTALNNAIEGEGLSVAGWRKMPVNLKKKSLPSPSLKKNMLLWLPES